MPAPIPYPLLQQWKEEVRTLDDPFITHFPKIELHVHIEGTLTPSLRYKLATRHALLPLHSERLGKDFNSLSELEEMYQLLEPPSSKGNGISAFFEAYYGSMEVLLEEEDFFELAMEYFDKAASMEIRYCEVLFDIQAHTRRGVSVKTVMDGFHRAQIKAEKELNVCLFPRSNNKSFILNNNQGKIPMDRMFPPQSVTRIRDRTLRTSLTIQRYDSRHWARFK